MAPLFQTTGLGCAEEAIARADFEPHSIRVQIGGVERSAWVVPPRGAHEGPHPLALGFHGRDGHGQDALTMFQLHAVDGGEDMLGIYPDGVAQPWYDGGIGWDNRAANSPDTLLVAALLRWAHDHYCIDGSRIFAVGFSWGGWMANHVACAQPGVYRAIVSVAGGGPLIACEDPVRALIAHGVQDQAEPIAEGRLSVDRWRRTNGCSEETRGTGPGSCVEFENCSQSESLVWCEHARGHEWPVFLGDQAIRRWLLDADEGR